VLNIFFRAERHSYSRLRFTASKESTAMNSGQPPHFTSDRADLGEASAIGSAAVMQDIFAKDLLFQEIEDLPHLTPFLRLFRRIEFDCLGLEIIDRFIA